MPVPTPTPIYIEGYEALTDPVSLPTDSSVTSRSATSAAMKDIVTEKDNPLVFQEANQTPVFIRIQRVIDCLVN